MICRNCNYILTGSEQFCPHCATPVSKKDNENEASALPPAIFTSDKLRDTDEIKQPSNRIFMSPEQESTEQDVSKGKKRLVLVSLTLLLVFLCTCAFFLAKKLDIAPVLSSLIPDTSQADVSQTESRLVTTKVSELSENYGLLPADISYKPTNCFVSSASSLPMRKGPDDTYAQITTIRVGQQLQIIGGSLLTDKWLYIYHPEEDLYGWAKAAFLSSAESLEESTESQEQTDERESDATEETTTE